MTESTNEVGARSRTALTPRGVKGLEAGSPGVALHGSGRAFPGSTRVAGEHLEPGSVGGPSTNGQPRDAFGDTLLEPGPRPRPFVAERHQCVAAHPEHVKPRGVEQTPDRRRRISDAIGKRQQVVVRQKRGPDSSTPRTGRAGESAPSRVHGTVRDPNRNDAT